jgi:hypothetical protein
LTYFSHGEKIRGLGGQITEKIKKGGRNFSLKAGFDLKDLS